MTAPRFLRTLRRLVSPPKVLITHGWVRGNLGDFCMTRILLTFLRKEFPGISLDLISIPGGSFEGKRTIASLVDNFIEQSYEADNAGMFPRYAAVINAPGGGTQLVHDARGPFMARDALQCRKLGIPHVMAGHSFHPDFDTDALKESLVVVREPASAGMLRARSLRPVEASDIAFAETFSKVPDPSTVKKTLLFLRFDHFQNISLDGSMLHADGRSVKLPPYPVVLASPDPARDERILPTLAEAWRVPYEPSRSLGSLLRLICGASHVAGDRYHPTIFAAMQSVPYTFLERQGNNRDIGLSMLLKEHDIGTLKTMAEHGLFAIRDFLLDRI